MKKQFKNTTIALFLAILFAVSACCSLCRKSSPKLDKLESSVWTLIELNANPIEESKITLTFNPEEKTISGQCPCNSFFGGYVLSENEEQNIKFQNIGATMKMCPDTEVEEAFVRAIGGVVRVKIDGENLMMINTSGELVAVLRATAQQ